MNDPFGTRSRCEGLHKRHDTGLKSRLASVGLCLMLGCSPGDDPAGEGVWAIDTLSAIETVVDLEEGLGIPVDLDVALDGTLHILDAAVHEILRVTPDGGVRTLAGGEGGGPGEFQGPTAFVVSEDTLRVADGGNGRIQVLIDDGIYVRSYPLPMPLQGFSASIAGNGMTALPTGGVADTSLVITYGPEGSLLLRVGKLPGQSFDIYNMTAIKNSIADGEVPDPIRNRALPALASDGSLWVALPGEGEVRRYDREGTLLWTRKLNMPVLTDIREEFFRSNAEEKRLNTFHMLRYFVDLEIVGDDLWALLGTPPGFPGRIVVIDGEGSLAREIVLPGLEELRTLAVDREEGIVYFTVSGKPVVYAGRLATM